MGDNERSAQEKSFDGRGEECKFAIEGKKDLNTTATRTNRETKKKSVPTDLLETCELLLPCQNFVDHYFIIIEVPSFHQPSSQLWASSQISRQKIP